MRKVILYLILFCGLFSPTSLFSQGINSLLKKAEKSYSNGDYIESAHYLEAALPKVKSKYTVFSEQYYQIILQLSVIYYQLLNDYDNSIRYLKEIRAFAIIVKNESPDNFSAFIQEYITANLALFRCYYFKDRLNEASVIAYETVDLVGPLNSAWNKNSEAIIAWSNLAEIYSSYELRDDKADSLYKAILLVMDQNPDLKNSYDYAACCFTYGSFLLKKGDYARAEKYTLMGVERFIDLYGEKDWNSIFSLYGLSTLYLLEGNIEKAELILYKVLDLAKKADPEFKNMHDYANFLNGLSTIHYVKGEYLKSLNFSRQSVNLHKLHDEKSSALLLAYQQLSNAYLALGYFDSSLISLNEASNIEREINTNDTISSLLTGYGSYYWRTGNYKAADSCIKSLIYFKEVLFNNNSRDLGVAILDYAVMQFSFGHLSMADSLFAKSGNILLGDIRRGFSYLSDKERENYVRILQDLYQVYSSLLHNVNFANTQDRNTYAQLKLSGSGLLLNTQTNFNRSIALSSNNEINDTYQVWQGLRRRIGKELSKPVNQQSAKLNSWIDEANNLEKELLTGSIEYQKSLKVAEYTWADLAHVLNPETDVLVDFYSFNYYDGIRKTDSVFYIAFVLRHQDTLPQIIPLFEEGQLSQLLMEGKGREGLNQLYRGADFTQSTETKVSIKMFDLFIQPLMSLIKNARNIYYTPAGLLHRISFDAIPIDNNTLLSDKYSLHRLTNSLELLDFGDSLIFKDIVLYGGLNYNADSLILLEQTMGLLNLESHEIWTDRKIPIDSTRGGGWKFLEGTKQEVLKIENLANSNDIKSMLKINNEGTEEHFKSLYGNASPSILHFATHGYFIGDRKINTMDLNIRLDNMVANSDLNNPLLRSGILMAGCNHTWVTGRGYAELEDGVLTAYEVSQSFIPHTQLVVLSACETGLGDIKVGEGVYGLQRAFKIAGAKYIIMSLWQVPDFETTEFMIAFYEALFKSRRVEYAFQQAQTQMKKKYKNEPYKWAAFVLTK